MDIFQKIKKISRTIFFATILLMMPFFNYGRKAWAQDSGGDNGGDSGGDNPSTGGSSGDLNLNFHLDNPLEGSGVSTVPDFIARVLDILLTIGIPVIAIFIIYAGFLFVTARGSEDQLKTAKSTLLWTVVGAAILLGSWVLAQALGETIKQFQ